MEDIEKKEDCPGKDKDSPKCKCKGADKDTKEWEEEVCKCKPIKEYDETDLLDEDEYLLSGGVHPLANMTHITDAGPFGAIRGSYKDNKAYEQYQ